MRIRSRPRGKCVQTKSDPCAGSATGFFLAICSGCFCGAAEILALPYIATLARWMIQYSNCQLLGIKASSDSAGKDKRNEECLSNQEKTVILHKRLRRIQETSLLHKTATTRINNMWKQEHQVAVITRRCENTGNKSLFSKSLKIWNHEKTPQEKWRP